MNRKRILSYLLLLVMVSLQSCHPKPKEKQKIEQQKVKSKAVTPQVKKEFYNLGIRESLNKPEKLLLSSITGSVQYISLETTPECLVSRVSDLKIYKENLFILDVTKGLFKFDKEGHYIKQIGKKGNGPGEYNMVFHFVISENSNQIILYCFGSKLIIYDLDTGKHKRSFTLNFDCSEMVEFPSENLCFFLPQDSDVPLENEAYICDLRGQKIDSIPDSRLPRISGKHATGLPVFYRNNDVLYYMNSFQDTLKTLSADFKMKPYVKLGLNNAIKANELKMERIPNKIQYPDFLIVEDIIETDNLFFVSIQQGVAFYKESETLKFLYHKKLGQLANVLPFVNDIDGGMPFWPDYKTNNKKLVDVFFPYEIMEYRNSSNTNTKGSKEFAEITKEINENDNPVIMIAKLTK